MNSPSTPRQPLGDLEELIQDQPSTLEPQALENRTTAYEDRSCKRCGEPVRGRRRNGYCSDRCRRRDERAAQKRDRQALMAALRDLVAAVECELGVGGDGE